MKDGTFEIRNVAEGDVTDVTDLLNAVIAKVGTTALEDPFEPRALRDAYLLGAGVYCCFVAVDRATGRIEGFQTLAKNSALPEGMGDIGTFARVDGAQRGVGTALFAATRERAAALGLSAISATIRGDNHGGLAFYGKQGFEDHAIAHDVPLKSGLPVDRITKRFTLKG